MKISAKARYGLAAMVCLATRYPNQSRMTVLEMSETLELSKIYLEQVFTQLRVAGLVQASKGPQGGYTLSRRPEEISAYEILTATETSLFASTPTTLGETSAYIEWAAQSLVYNPLDQCVKDKLSSVTLRQITDQAIENLQGGYMYYL